MSKFNYPLKYKTFDSLLEDVRVDLKSFSLEGKIEPQQLIKVALRVNYDLGLRIVQDKEKVLDIVNGKARLPEDFRVMNYALLCGEFTQTFVNPQGTHIEESQIVPVYKDPIEPNPCTDPEVCPCDPLRMPNTTTPLCLTKCVDSCGNPTSGFQLIQKIHTTTRHYKMMHPIRFKNSHSIHCECPNLFWMCRDEAFIKDNFIWMYNYTVPVGNKDHISSCGTGSCGTSTCNTCNPPLSETCTSGCSTPCHKHKKSHFRDDNCGHLFINYEGALEDDEGNVLVPDHPYFNEYYEYAIKDRILENILMDGDSALALQQYKIVKQELRGARNNALSVVNTPNFQEMKELWELNRKAQYTKFYHMFSSFPPNIYRGENFMPSNVVRY